MTEMCFSPCSIFPGEVEDYYCTSCHTTCSGLSLLVGPHTGHNRVPLIDAATYLPAALQRDANALVMRIQEEYIRPKTTHCNTLHATLAHMQQERQKKRRELEELQRELGTLDEKIDNLTEECAMALCHWSHQRDGFLSQVRRLLRGADALARTLGIRENQPIGSERCVDVDIAAPTNFPPPFALRAVRKELHEVRRLLTQPLEWLEQEDEEDKEERSEGGKELRLSRSVRNGADAVVSHRSKKEDYGQLSGTSRTPRHVNDHTLVSSDAEAVLQQLLAAHMKRQGEPHTQKSPSARAYVAEVEGTSSCNSHKDVQVTAERRRWKNEYKRRERLLHEGLNVYMREGFFPGRTTTKIAGGVETDVNDMSSSDSVKEAVAHLLRNSQNDIFINTTPHQQRRPPSCALASEED
ncbi:hypothetical protein C3747_23g105 [Trypanosoma cruzi]|uniref:Uncharacterized protein n=2 Tax=Trypanosoma cruzi TaxID=5693 RepID=Q4E1L8_TRYCC|nr:hypothetical protein, conserved [Trypanosoma cruzi]EAN98654.1 hypothetical protein, conserved [Trypanosoma cruzi]PWV16447.1 hypothetical protein C3747_23g105 [Trypanosoma cruzi]RNC47663.1 hypothetical protein TcCL_NonESM02428 [Trypanosoma cruzi]|eukprot:XP_820505.1 hypothetical protein [Trypanosoma cruzi strain CL Brener]